jgi:uncharacterized NAD(P)/FAD-binding protein YdhS
MARVVIVGGGFSGAAAAVQLVRRSAALALQRRGGPPLAVTLVEPRAELGHGLAYSATDPDHRLNVPVERHALDPDDPDAFARWLAAHEVLRDDPEARLPDGRVFARRRDFGRFLADTVRACAAMPDGSTIVHRRDAATRIEPDGAGWRVHLAGGAALPADLVIVATGNPPPRLPAFVSPAAAARRGVIANPLQTARLHDEIGRDDRVCVLGSGLTALDVLSTLVRRGQRGPVTVLSRHGLRPHGQPTAAELPALRTPQAPFEAPGGPLPDFIAALGPVPRLRPLLRALRARVRADAAAGRPWQAAFGALRDSVWRFWPAVPEADKRQYLRHLRTWYDVHRFLSPPPNEAMVQAAVDAGQVTFVAARVMAVDLDADGRRLQVRYRPRGRDGTVAEPFDALVNCTGIDGSAGGANPLLQRLLAEGWLAPGPAGWGVAVDREGRAIGRDGVARDTLRVVGPPTVGVLGDPIGAGFTAMQLRRAMPGLLATLSSAPARTAGR